jgi:serine O-acetyltransferase
MMEDLSLLIVRMSGGFWKFRERMRARRKGSIGSRLTRAIYYVYLHRYGAYIGHATSFASQPCFPHNLHGVFIAGNAKVGRNCVIFQHVTLGANAIPGSKGVGCPTIGDNVYIGAGAKIIGNIVVGDNCRIGANCVVTTNVPANSLVVLPAPRIIEREAAPDNRYFAWSPEGPVYFRDGEWVLEQDPAIVEKLKDAF